MTHAAARFLQYAFVLWVAVTLNFALPRLAPGDPLEFLVGDELSSMRPEDRDTLRRQLGLDESIVVQYGRYLSGLARGDLGRSFRFGIPVTDILAERLRWTLLLALPSLVLSVVIGTLLGAYAAWRRQQRSDVPYLVGALVLDSVPPFWVGMVLIAVFAGVLGWLPAFGAMAVASSGSGVEMTLDLMRRLAMPVATLTMVGVPYTFLIARASLLTTLGEDYITVSEAKGLSPRRILFRHALPNALLPVYTYVALSLGTLAGGAVIIETVFGYPGVGRLMTEAAAMRDFPLLQGGMLLMAAGVVGANALADLTYPLLDPRVRRG